MKKIDSENEKKRENKDEKVTYSKTIPHLSGIFFKIKIHWKNWLNTSFDVECNALLGYVILMEKIDSKNGEKREKKDGML